jgi:hypothetical protein
MTPLVIVLIGVGIIVLLGAHYQFERLVRAEHDLHYDAWLADGRPPAAISVTD